MLKLSSKNIHDTSKANYYLEIADLYYETNGSLDSVYSYFDKAYRLFEKHNLSTKKADALCGRALANREKGLYNSALQDYLKALRIAEMQKDTFLLTRSYNGLAIVHAIQGEVKQAYEFYSKAKEIHLIRNNTKGLASIYNNLGLLFYSQNLLDSAVYFYSEALKFNELNNNLRGVATVNENLGLLYLEHQNNPEKALHNFARSLQIWRKMGDNNSVCITLDYIAMALLEAKRYKATIDTATLSLQLAVDVGNILQQRNAYLRMYKAHSALGDYKQVYENYKNYIFYRDSLSNKSQMQEFTELRLTYEFDKKRSLDSLQQELVKAEFQQKIKSQKSIIWTVILGLVVALFLMVFAARGYRIYKKTSGELAKQKLLLEYRNKEILDSINYAKRIQEAILPPDEQVKKMFPDSFIFYKPKDIVSGDFYWIEEKNNKIYFASVDCTGHGVPGAFMSIVGRNGLNDSLAKLIDPNAAEILDSLNKYVNYSLHQAYENSNVRDGMDLALCVWDKEQATLDFAGANNALWVVKSNSEVLTEIKGDKQPIGRFLGDVTKRFTNHRLILEKGDKLYLFTDGFADQFGGEKGKKFMNKSLKALCLTVSSMQMSRQVQRLHEVFEQWKGPNEQIDDICVIGVKI
ncbi:MAG: tetratricopeptide repeat protein [Flavobacteriales bacterium]